MLDEWAAISPGPDRHTFNVLRADSTHPLDFWIGRDQRGRFTFQLDAAGFQGASTSASPAGMDVLIDLIEERRSRLTLLLHDHGDFEIFRILCADLLEVTRSYQPNDASQAMHMLLGRLHQWQAILARRRDNLLSRSEILGLLGELLFLRDLLLPRVDPATAVGAWRGSYGEEQDFALADIIFEVKTQGTTADRLIQISSEDQLDTSASRIILCRQGVARAQPDDEQGRSLNGIIAEIRDALTASPAAQARFDLGLAAARWEELPDYDEIWTLVERQFYEVAPGFPRIVPADLRPGVVKVRYQIRAAECAPFRAEEADILAELGR